MRRTIAVCTVLLLMLVSYGLGRTDVQQGNVGAADGDCQTFPQTGKSACGEFLAYWKTNGGLAQQGYPISDVFSEKSETDGNTYQVQYFERAVFEMHPELPQGQRVLLTLLGAQKFKTRYNGTQPSGCAAFTTMPSLPTGIATPRPVSTQTLSVTYVGSMTKAARCQSIMFSIRSVPQARCTIAVTYLNGTTNAAGLEPKIANDTGLVLWTWVVDSNAALGTARIVASCTMGTNTGSTESSFEVL